MFGRERKSRPVRFDRQAANQNSSKPSQTNQNVNRFKTKIEMTEELLEADLDQYKRPKFKVNASHNHECTVVENLLHSKSFILLLLFFSFLGGDVVWASWLGEDYSGSCYCKACWVQRGGNQCQVRNCR